MTLNQILYFRKVARLENYHQAAEELPQWNMYGRCGTHRFWKNGHIFLRG